MTEKQERIIQAALKLFATEGYASTPTSKVAKAAGVSEGLIFRHFGNKEGLLDAVLEKSQAAAKKIMAEVVMTSDPREVIRKIIEVLFAIGEDQYEMWRLIYALKWQTDRYNDTIQEPVKLVLKNAFEKLGYDDPDAEVELIYMLINGAATSILLHELGNKADVLAALKKKYEL